MKFKNPSTQKDLIIILFFTLLCLILTQIKTGFEYNGKTEREIYRHRGVVLATDNADIEVFGVVHTGFQHLEVRLLGGPHNGQIIEVQNQLFGVLERDEVYADGDELLVQYFLNPDQTPGLGTARGHYRIHLEITLISLFALALIAVAGLTGFKAILSFAFATLMIWKIMLPMFLKGFDPIWVALGVVAGLTASISFLVGGLTRKGFVTFAGAFLGLALTAGLAVVFGRLFHIHGAVRPYAENLLHGGFAHLQLTPIFIAGIFLAASGAVMDLAMDIAASMEEVKRKHPEIHVIEHIRSGLRVGRSVIGTMTTTLLLAYSSSYIFMFMLFISQDIPPIQIFNLNYVAAEVLNTMVGSFGLVTVAPFTALIGGLVMRRN
ncbi:YibE/F family protein [Pontiella agarivorans]|uniref:YibE/F family protein n=1 Tax=Pontiella agarivorans TaxID=3038953 RepID=A0ABU5MVW8_9BACT|nr:YibE/F family protein [Pontiella agarivorans]MDZ8118359.1 YibE/F family protein [Pontiella agarivorans]